MIYVRERRSVGDGRWHCPFPPEWVERMKRAAKACKHLTAEDIEAFDQGNVNYRIPPGDFLSEEQDARGLPMSYCRKEAERYRDWPECCIAIYDYDSIPEMVITNGHDDWPLRQHDKILTA